MRLIYCSFIALLWGITGAGAQSFSRSSGIATQPTEQVSAPVAATDESEAPIKDAVVNISGTQVEEQEPTYDNSAGKVISFKIVKGKVIFEDDDDRKILVSYDDFKVTRGMDNIVRCSMRVFVLNDLTERINNLGFKLIWPDISTSVQLVKVNPGVRTYRDIMLLGEGCFSMDKNPTIEVNRCRVKGKSEEECANAVKWFRHMQ